VGTLNRVVRDLREALYQEKLKSQTSVREALDEQARRVFAALCQGCQLGHPARYSPSGGDYYHAREDDPTRIQFCLANDMRLVLDPDGRLASPEA